MEKKDCNLFKFNPFNVLSDSVHVHKKERKASLQISILCLKEKVLPSHYMDIYVTIH